MIGETYYKSVEVIEARCGFRIVTLAMNTSEGGEGQFNGGKGCIVRYLIRTNDAKLNAIAQGCSALKIVPFLVKTSTNFIHPALNTNV